jgi:hypothetical protein
MNFKTKISLVLLAGVAVIYTACKKAGSDASGPILAPSAVSGQIALNLTESLFGGYGGFDLSNGLNAPSSLGVKTHLSHLLHSLNNPFCGLVIDTTLNAQVTAGSDTSASVSGHIKFSFICSNDIVTGFTTNDDLNISLTTPQFSVVSKISENLTMLAIDPKNNDSKLSLDGNLNSSGIYSYKTGTKKSGTRSFSYILSALILNPNNDGDIISGSASFTTKGTGSTGAWSYIGTITFLGDHKATITINGKAYNVNLQTGVVG